LKFHLVLGSLFYLLRHLFSKRGNGILLCEHLLLFLFKHVLEGFDSLSCGISQFLVLLIVSSLVLSSLLLHSTFHASVVSFGGVTHAYVPPLLQLTDLPVLLLQRCSQLLDFSG